MVWLNDGGTSTARGPPSLYEAGPGGIRSGTPADS